jgi:hypothetical protein
MANINAVIKNPKIIIANTVPITTTQSNPTLDLKNNILGLPQNYLSHLLDVDSSKAPVGGEVLTYNANTGKYDLEPLPTGTFALDGGNF